MFDIPFARFKIGHTPRKLPAIPAATFRFNAYLLQSVRIQRTQRNQLYHIYRDKSRICRNYICKFLMNNNLYLTIYHKQLLRHFLSAGAVRHQLPKIDLSTVRTVSPTFCESTTSRALSGQSVMILSTPSAIIFCISPCLSTVHTKTRFP